MPIKGAFINYDLGGVGKLEGGHNFLGHSYTLSTLNKNS